MARSITLTWTPPTTREDGSALTIDHYKIYRSGNTTGNTLPTPAFFGDVAAANANSFTYGAIFLEGSTYEFQIDAVSVNGIEGTKST